MAHDEQSPKNRALEAIRRAPIPERALFGAKRRAVALKAGFPSGGWAGALRKGIEISLAQRKAKTGYVSPYEIAMLYADLGDKDHAFEWLDTAYQEHDLSLLYGLRTDFKMDSLRSDPRYAGLVRKIGFPQ